MFVGQLMERNETSERGVSNISSKSGRCNMKPSAVPSQSDGYIEHLRNVEGHLVNLSIVELCNGIDKIESFGANIENRS